MKEPKLFGLLSDGKRSVKAALADQTIPRVAGMGGRATTARSSYIFATVGMMLFV
jgi:hypothetical protein